MRALLAACRFLTRLPLPGRPSTAEEVARGLAWFPLVGALVGALIGGAYQLAALGLPPAVAAVLAVAFGLLLTGGFHEDGASDAADGLGGGWERERVLAIMKDSRLGAYGAMALWCVLSLRAAALVALGPLAAPGLALAMAWGRWSSAPLSAWLPPLGQGLAKEIAGGFPRSAPALASALALAVTALVWWLGLERAAWAALGAVLATLFWAAYLARRLGGHSGDLLGAGNQWSEAVAVLVLLWGAA